ncbi:NAD(P)H-hydrate dehydratase [Gudongella sp. DL1XJH-153]|uniref:NAD(P)H-hydrate dehydratase n=1 Tax=Gudongella sp. DL1XJH-153 TaxID=3409804 RepID=UPI003BB4BE7B
MGIRTGVDIVSNKRIEKLMESKRDSFYRRIFCDAEIEYLETRNHSIGTVAGIYSAKEAVSKVLGTGIGQISWKDIAINHEDGGRPYLVYNYKLQRIMDFAGVRHIDISISNEEEYSMAIAVGETTKNYEIPENMTFRLPKRPLDTHKGNFGRIGVIGGSQGMLGAVYLATYGALRSGAGLVHAIIETELARDFGLKVVEVMVREASDIYAYRKAQEGLDSLVLGPGYGLGEKQKSNIEDCLLNFENPVVLDADGLNSLSDNPTIIRHRKGKTIITPHPGEMGRLLKMSTADVQNDREGAAREFAKTYGVVTVLKGHNTIVTDGERMYVNKSGNPGMATAGSGDILSGVAGTFLAQVEDSFEAAVMAVYVHGLAGDMAKDEKGEYGMIASDIVENLPRAVNLIVE